MELLFLLVLVGIMAFALGSGYPVAFALPGAAILSIALAAVSGYLFAGDTDAYFAQGGPGQWLSAGVTNLRGVYWEVERDTLIAIPLFIFMGIMLQRSKIAEDLLITMAQLFGPVPGGLGISVVFVGALLAATTGIVGATVVAMGLISLPAMLRNNYSKPLATGTIAASGTLGQIIPPSIVLIILADQLASAADQASTTRKALYKDGTGELSMPSAFDVTSTSAGEMFLGALVPGLVLVGLYMAYILVFALIKPSAAPAIPRDGAMDRAFLGRLLLVLVPPLALIFLVLGSIILGVATVNQAGAIGAAGALIMAGYKLTEGRARTYWPAIIAVLSIVVLVFTIRNFETNIKAPDASGLGLAIAGLAVVALLGALFWSALRAYRVENTLTDVMIETAKTTSLVFIILLGAAMLTAAFRAFGGEELVKEFLEGLPGGFWAKFIIVMAVLFVLGFFLDFIEIAVVVVPIVAPILLADPAANITAVWLGVMIGLNIQTSFLTPPFGFALFYLRGVAPAIVKTLDMYKGVIAFIILQIAALAIVGAYPSLVNYVPNRVSLLSETAPPPRNPKLQYCLESYAIENLARDRAAIESVVADVEALDLAALPEGLRDDLTSSVEETRETLDLLARIRPAEEATIAAAAPYRPLHARVRRLQADARALDEEVSRLRVRASRLRGEDNAAARERLETRIAADEAERDRILALVPAEFEERRAAYVAVAEEEAKLRSDYQRAADGAYGDAAEIAATLRGTAALRELEARFAEVRTRIEAATAPDEALEDEVKAFGDAIGEVEGTSKVKSAVNRARRALRARSFDTAKALEELEKGRELFAAQLEWRASAEGPTTDTVLEYERVLSETIGTRQQERMTREQALFVANCSAGHRDISLNF